MCLFSFQVRPGQYAGLCLPSPPALVVVFTGNGPTMKEDGPHMRREPLSFWSTAIRLAKAQQIWAPMDTII